MILPSLNLIATWQQVPLERLSWKMFYTFTRKGDFPPPSQLVDTLASLQGFFSSLKQSLFSGMYRHQTPKQRLFLKGAANVTMAKTMNTVYTKATEIRFCGMHAVSISRSETDTNVSGRETHTNVSGRETHHKIRANQSRSQSFFRDFNSSIFPSL